MIKTIAFCCLFLPLSVKAGLESEVEPDIGKITDALNKGTLYSIADLPSAQSDSEKQKKAFESSLRYDSSRIVNTVGNRTDWKVYEKKYLSNYVYSVTFYSESAGYEPGKGALVTFSWAKFNQEAPSIVGYGIQIPVKAAQK